MLHSLPEYPQSSDSSPHGGFRTAGLFPSFFRPRRYLYPAGFPFRLPHEATGTSFVPPLHQSFTCCIRCRNIRKAPAPLRMEGSAPPGSFSHFPVPAATFIRQAFRSGFPMKRQGLPSCRLSTSRKSLGRMGEVWRGKEALSPERASFPLQFPLIPTPSLSPSNSTHLPRRTGRTLRDRS